MSRVLRMTFLAAACACAGSASAGGPLWVVPSGGTIKAARWEGTVQVYLDRGNLSVGTNCIVDENWN